MNSITLDEDTCGMAGVVATPAELFATLFLVSIPEKSPLLNSSDFAKEVIACSFLVFPLISTLAPLTFISRIVQLLSSGQRLLRSVSSW